MVHTGSIGAILMPLVRLVREYYTRRPDMISQYSVVKKGHMRWLCQVNDTTLMSVWPMDYRYIDRRNYRYSGVGIRTDFVAIARKNGSTQWNHTISHWWFFKYDGDMFREVHWESLSTDQQLTVVKVFMKYELRGMRLWGDDMEVLVALEQA